MFKMIPLNVKPFKKKSVKMSPKVIPPNKNVPNGLYKSVRPVLERLRNTAQKPNVRRFHVKFADLVPPKFPELKNVSIEKKPLSKKYQMKPVTWNHKRSGAYFLWNINTFFSWFEKGYQFGDMFADLLWFQVTGFVWYFLDNGFFSIETFFSSGNLCGTRSTNFTWNLLTFGFWAVFLNLSSTGLTLLDRPFGTFLFGSITLGDIFTLFFLDGFTFYGIVLNVMFSITCSTSRFVYGLTNFFAISFQENWCVTESYGFLGSYLTVLNETTLLEVFFTIFFLLRLEVSGICCVTFFTVAVFACNNIVVFCLFNHDDFVDTSFSSSSNGSNVKSNIITTSTSSLTRSTSSIYFMMGMVFFMMMLMMIMMGSFLVAVEWKCITEIFSCTSTSYTTSTFLSKRSGDE